MMQLKTKSFGMIALLSLLSVASLHAETSEPIDIGSRLELFVDRHLIDELSGDAHLMLHEPRDAGKVLDYDLPWEGRYSIYTTVIHEGSKYRMYYRGWPHRENKTDRVTCYAESADGIHWTKSELGLVEVNGSKQNNVVIEGLLASDFTPFLDTNPDAPSDQRYKAFGHSGEFAGKLALWAFVSPDGFRWRLLQEKEVIPWKHKRGLDCQNLAFWSDYEQQYICYMRMTPDLPNGGSVRAIGRATSKDFIHWSEPQLMQYSDTGTGFPSADLYTNQTSPYFRAPHIYLAPAARFMDGRRLLTDEQARAAALDIDPIYLNDMSDSVLLTTRGGMVYEREFLEALIKPRIGLENWTSRSNYPALNIVQTGDTEMSLYVNEQYGYPTAHLRRYTMRLDGLASLRAGFEGGELITKPLVFAGDQLLLNFATSAAGSIRVEIQDADRNAIPGFALADCVEVIGNEIERAVAWKAGADVSSLAGRPVRIRFVLKDADLFSYRFE